MKHPQSEPRRNPFKESLPAPDTRELGENTGWEMWDQAMKRSEAQFADTAPMTAPFPLEGGDRRYALTQPSSLPTTRDVMPQARTTTVEAVMLEARKSNRVCPRPMWWEEMYARMPEWGRPGAQLPQAPLSGDSWDRTPALAKRMSFRAHVEWCEEQQCLTQLLDYLKALPQGAWHHMGE